jgi:hypothetical protein
MIRSKDRLGASESDLTVAMTIPAGGDEAYFQSS